MRAKYNHHDTFTASESECLLQPETDKLGQEHAPIPHGTLAKSGIPNAKGGCAEQHALIQITRVTMYYPHRVTLPPLRQAKSTRLDPIVSQPSPSKIAFKKSAPAHHIGLSLCYSFD